MGQAVHAPPQAHGLPGGGGRRDNFPAGAIRLRTRLGCRGFRLNRRVASASFCARATRCRKGSVLPRTGRSADGLRGGRSSCQPLRFGRAQPRVSGCLLLSSLCVARQSCELLAISARFEWSPAHARRATCAGLAPQAIPGGDAVRTPSLLVATRLASNRQTATFAGYGGERDLRCAANAEVQQRSRSHRRGSRVLSRRERS